MVVFFEVSVFWCREGEAEGQARGLQAEGIGCLPSRTPSRTPSPPPCPQAASAPCQGPTFGARAPPSVRISGRAACQLPSDPTLGLAEADKGEDSSCGKRGSWLGTKESVHFLSSLLAFPSSSMSPRVKSWELWPGDTHSCFARRTRVDNCEFLWLATWNPPAFCSKFEQGTPLFLAFINLMRAVASHPVSWGFGSFTWQVCPAPMPTSFPVLLRYLACYWARVQGRLLCPPKPISVIGFGTSQAGFLTANREANSEITKRYWSAVWPAELLDDWRGGHPKGQEPKAFTEEKPQNVGTVSADAETNQPGWASATHHLNDHGQVT